MSHKKCLNQSVCPTLKTKGQFHQHFTCCFYSPRSQQRKKIFNSSSFLRFWDLHTWKLVDEIDPNSLQISSNLSTITEKNVFEGLVLAYFFLRCVNFLALQVFNCNSFDMDDVDVTAPFKCMKLDEQNMTSFWTLCSTECVADLD